jgi:signal peptidase I
MGMLMLREVLETLVLTLVLFALIRTGIQNYKIEGQSMQPNFEDGQYLLVNKLAYVFGEPQRGDVVVFHYPRDPERDFIKRVVGLPGDVVEVRDGRVFVNGSLLDEPYNTLPINYTAGRTVVEPRTVYVLGDNRGNSEDSHRWGLLNQDLIIGTAWFTIYPFDLAGMVAHEAPQVGLPTALGP